MGQAYSIGLGIAIACILMIIGSSLVIFLDLLDKMVEGCLRTTIFLSACFQAPLLQWYKLGSQGSTIRPFVL